MDTEEKIRKLETLPWQALYNALLGRGFEEEQIKNRNKEYLIQKLIENNICSEEVEYLTDEYIYGDRMTFTLWTFEESLDDEAFSRIEQLKGKHIQYFNENGFRNLSFLSADRREDRFEVLYVYSKEYRYLDEQGQNRSIWEQHRGCIWIGMTASYLACISKHERMTSVVVGYVSRNVGNLIKQLKPPKSAIEKCVNPTAISRIVLQGIDGEKTVVSRTGGITEQQRDEVDRIKPGRVDTSGSYITTVTDEMNATVKYNIGKGSIGIYRHLPAKVLFDWSKNAIDIVLDEVEKLKGRPAEEIFSELGRKLKWTGLPGNRVKAANWFLTQVIAAKDEHEVFSQQIPEDIAQVLRDDTMFTVIPRIYCNQCEDYQIPVCRNCRDTVRYSASGLFACNCGAPLEIVCDEGHTDVRTANWHVPKTSFLNKLNKKPEECIPGCK